MTDSRFLKMIVFVLLVVVSSCTHETKEPEPVPCPYNSDYEEMKDWYYFKEGTYWVYEEESTGDLDTLYVFSDSESSDNFFEWYAISSRDGYTYNYWFNIANTTFCLSQEGCTCNRIKRSKAKPGDFVGESMPFLYPLIINDYIYVVGYPNGQITSGTSSLVAATEFILPNDSTIDTFRWEVSADQSNSGFPSNYEIGKNVGFVRIEYPDENLSWRLIEMNILQ
jgi:hypothetical protein